MPKLPACSGKAPSRTLPLLRLVLLLLSASAVVSLGVVLQLSRLAVPGEESGAPLGNVPGSNVPGSSVPIAAPPPPRPVLMLPSSLHFSPVVLSRLPIGSTVSINQADISQCRSRMTSAFGSWDAAQRARGLSLVVYHLGSPSANISLDVQTNNVLLFVSALRRTDPAFYVFQVLGGAAGNPLARLLPRHLDDHVCVINVLRAPYDVTAQMVTLALLGHAVLQWRYVFFLNQGTRGPLTHRADAEWLAEYWSIFASHPNVALAGPQVGCFETPHVQTHAWIMPTRLLAAAIAYHLSAAPHELKPGAFDYVQHAEIGMSRYFQLGGFQVGSRSELLRSMRLHKCTRYTHGASLPQPAHADAVFFKFGGSVMRRLCAKATSNQWEVNTRLSLVQSLTAALAKEAGLVWPERLCE